MTKTIGGDARIGRRSVLAAGAAALAAPFVLSRPARAAGEVVVRTSGGVYEEVMRKAVYDPFTKATGITVVPVAATTAKLMTMLRSGNIEIDVVDTGDGVLITLERLGALTPISYGTWRYGKPDEIMPELKLPYRVGNFIYSTILGYNTEAFPNGQQPKNWVEFWDVARFPGPRMLADMASGQTHLEFALIADGVPKDRLYPMDIERAFKSMSRIKPAIRKFWDTGALAAQMMADKEVVAGAIWSGRLQTVIDKGAPLAIEWDQNMIQVQAYSIFKDARNLANAQLFVDFAAQAEGQVEYGRELRYGPANQRSYDLMPKDLLTILPGGPKYREMGFYQDVAWWDQNREAVNRAWTRWVRG